ncbi:hypothetical protein HA466_0157370 [Hirschfeldia incana]|nr:hypothetical protein HA466_0157370 [Hirschfeldia incana]
MDVINTAPSTFLFSVIQVMVRLAMTLLLGKLFCIDMKLLLLASNANIGGPTTACAMVTAKGWTSLVVPGFSLAFWSLHSNFSWHWMWIDL